MKYAGADAPASEARLRLGTSNGKYLSLAQHVVGEMLDDHAALAETVRDKGVVVGAGRFQAIAQIRDALRPFLRGTVFDGVARTEDGSRLRFRRRDGGLLDLEQLGASEIQGFLFAITFRRFGLDHSVVLIDEPELHIHPAEQAGFLRAVTALGRDNQIIAATTSTEVLAAAETGPVIDMTKRGSA
jgi:predicted ATPase